MMKLNLESVVPHFSAQVYYDTRSCIQMSLKRGSFSIYSTLLFNCNQEQRPEMSLAALRWQLYDVIKDTDRHQNCSLSIFSISLPQAGRTQTGTGRNPS